MTEPADEARDLKDVFDYFGRTDADSGRGGHRLRSSWIHEIKTRWLSPAGAAGAERVRLFTRNGHDW